jgi:photosystem I P700 chlorophyll a apoprotein A1
MKFGMLIFNIKTKATTWIWVLHADAHDFDDGNTTVLSKQIFASNLAHIGLVSFWLCGMLFHGAYFANTTAWQSDPRH